MPVIRNTKKRSQSQIWVMCLTSLREKRLKTPAVQVAQFRHSRVSIGPMSGGLSLPRALRRIGLFRNTGAMPLTTLVVLIVPPVLLLALTIWYYVTADERGDGTEP